jgi:hypothetical protein
MISTVHPRPFTSKLTAEQIATVAYYSPAKAIEHIVHAWVALGEALRAATPAEERARIEYARRRLGCAVSEPVAVSVKPRERTAFLSEVESLKTAIASYML